MRSLALILPLCLIAATVTVAAQDADPQVAHGRQVFTQRCAPCHGQGPGDDRSAMLPGTAALTEKYDGTRPGALELRNDLPAPVLSFFVRRGAGAMPAFRPAELSDDDIAAIAAYLAVSSAAADQ